MAEEAQKKKRTYNIHKLYSVEGGVLKRKNKMCPKCATNFLAAHKDRLTCGKCGYMEKAVQKEKPVE
ncbi:30S ribosomal protein S27ae [Nanoarchaeota archaeon]